MAELKTKPNQTSVDEFLAKVDNEQKRVDSYQILELMKKVTGCEPIMWGDSIIGFGEYHYKYASGREGDWFLTGFSPRKQNFSVYLMSCENDKNLGDLFSKLGKHKVGKSCLYFNKLTDIDINILEQLIHQSVEELKAYRG